MCTVVPAELERVTNQVLAAKRLAVLTPCIVSLGHAHGVVAVRRAILSLFWTATPDVALSPVLLQLEWAVGLGWRPVDELLSSMHVRCQSAHAMMVAARLLDLLVEISLERSGTLPTVDEQYAIFDTAEVWYVFSCEYAEVLSKTVDVKDLQELIKALAPAGMASLVMRPLAKQLAETIA